MLRGLDIRDILIIDRLVLEAQPGLNVLTGETGAGKSILLDALGFVLGWRGRADLVRPGAAQGEVSAWFDLPADHPARAVLDDAGIIAEDELILRRINTPEGRKTAWVNDTRVSGDVLRRLSDMLVELHGQHDDRGLLDPRGHRRLLDAYGGHEPLLRETRAAWTELRRARTELAEAEAALDAARSEEEFLRHAVDELDALAPEPGEEAALDARRRLMQAAEKVLGDVQRAQALLSGDEGAEARAIAAARLIEGAAEPLAELSTAPMAALDRALVELSEAQAGIDACLTALEFDPSELDATADRLFSLRELARKHQVAPDDLADLAARFRAGLDRIDGGAAGLAARQEAVAAAEAVYDRAASALSDARQQAAAALDTAMAAELAPLKMERAEFTTCLSEADPGPEGRDAVAFEVATNPGAPSGPLNRIASGGELSRFLLALKVCLTQESRGLTLIFDEIDRGVGGATADAVGRRLAALAAAAGGQVLVVTHSPQVAALGQHHWRVEKHVKDEMTRSTVTALAAADRVDEIARMLSGDRITDEARGAARALLAP
ncbi:MAG: DNA repair protein RecN [Pseudomonadota bacterium]